MLPFRPGRDGASAGYLPKGLCPNIGRMHQEACDRHLGNVYDIRAGLHDLRAWAHRMTIIEERFGRVPMPLAVLHDQRLTLLEPFGLN